MATRLGIRSKLYYNSATYGSPTWVEVSAVNDWKESISGGKAEGQTRGELVNLVSKTDISLSWTGTIKRDASTASIAFREAMLTTAVLDVLILDDDKETVGAVGWRADVQVFKCDHDQGRQSVIYEDVEVMPTHSTNAVKAAKVGAGPAMVYAPITEAATLTYA